MTAKRASRIMALEVRVIQELPRRYVYGAFNGGPDPVVRAAGSNPAEALEKLVKSNYDRVGAIVFEQQHHRCLMCGRFTGLERHHIIPRARGGRLDTRENLSGLCGIPCHDDITNNRRALEPHPRILEFVREHGYDWTPEGWIQKGKGNG